MGSERQTVYSGLIENILWRCSEGFLVSPGWELAHPVLFPALARNAQQHPGQTDCLLVTSRKSGKWLSKAFLENSP